MTWIEPSALDASGEVRLSDVTHSPGDGFPVGVTPVKYTFVDGSGNNASCQFIVIVSEGKNGRIM